MIVASLRLHELGAFRGSQYHGTRVGELLFHVRPKSLCFRLNYFSWNRQVDVQPELLPRGSFVTFGLLLPLLRNVLEVDDDNCFAHNYAMIESQHSTQDVAGDLCYA
jgi:hypothetical protein